MIAKLAVPYHRLLHDIEMPIPAGHMIVIFAIDANKIFYHDPEVGQERTVSRQIFVQAWENLRKDMVTVWQQKER
jgi:uncharacterized protein YvpB